MQRLYAQFNTIIIHPLITITICLMLGIWFASPVCNYAMIGVVMAGCSIYHFLSAESLKRAFFQSACLILAFTLGAGLAHYQRTTHAHTATLLSHGPYHAVAKVISVQESEKAQYPYTVQLELIKLKKEYRDAPWQATSAVIAAFCHSIPFVCPDDIIYLEDCTFSKHNPNIGFNDYLIKSGINGTLFTHHLKYTLLQRPAYSWQRWIAALRKDLFDRVRHKMSEANAAFYSSLFLGNCQTYKQYLKGMKTQFGIWGLSHFLARSGLHLVLFIYVWHLLLAYIPIRSRYKYILMLLLNTIYLLLSWSSLSFMRSFASLCFYYLAHIWQQQPSTLHSITLITCGCLIMNPMQLFFLDFQLSFGLTFALAWIYQAYSWHRVKLASNS